MLYACGCSLTAAASVARIYWRGTRRGQRRWRRSAAVEEDLLSSLDLLSQEPWLPKFFLFFCTPQRICACGILLVHPPLLYSGWHQITKMLVLLLMMILMMMTRMHFSHITMVRRRRRLLPRRCWCCRMCPLGCVFWIWSMNSSGGKCSFLAKYKWLLYSVKEVTKSANLFVI